MTSREAMRLIVQALTDQTEEELLVNLNPMAADMVLATPARSHAPDDRFLVAIHVALLWTDDLGAQHYRDLKRVIEGYLAGELRVRDGIRALSAAGFQRFPSPQQLRDA